MRGWLGVAQVSFVPLLSVALGLGVAGCFGDHQSEPSADAGAVGPDAAESSDAAPSPDGAPGPDGGDCRVDPGFTSGLRCSVAADGTAIATLVGASHGGCCASATPQPSVSVAGTDITVDLAYLACSCCEGCPCLSEPMDLDVPLGALPVGTYSVHSGADTCALTVGLPAMCTRANVSETRMPLFLYADQAFAATLVSYPTGECGCTPEVPAISTTMNDLHLELCSCCLACDCVGSPGYEASTVGPVLPLGITSLSIPHGAASVTVVARGSGHDVPVTGLRVVGPDPTHTRGGPALWWVAVSGTDALCCVSPEPLVDHTTGASGEIDLAVTSAAIDPCGCIGSPQPFEAWHSLGELAPGSYTLVAAGLRATFTVPLGATR